MVSTSTGRTPSGLGSPEVAPSPVTGGRGPAGSARCSPSPRATDLTSGFPGWEAGDTARPVTFITDAGSQPLGKRYSLYLQLRIRAKGSHTGPRHAQMCVGV
ncbi:unnamed protein product [Eretmochelys imbricata]